MVFNGIGTPRGVFEEPEVLEELENIASFSKFVRVLSSYVNEIIDVPRTFEQLRTEHGALGSLATYLYRRTLEHSVVAALLILKWHYSNAESEDAGLTEARGYACEILAWRFLVHLSDEERMTTLLQDIPALSRKPEERTITQMEHERPHALGSSGEAEPLLSGRRSPDEEAHVQTASESADGGQTTQPKLEDDLTTPFIGLNTVEIAAVADAKKFLSQKPVQRIITDIWNGSIVFWDTLNVDTKKQPKRYDKNTANPYSRLRVPKYQKIFEAVFLLSFLGLYYAVLIENAPMKLTFAEILLYFWLAAFAYDEFGEYRDAGTLFYAADIWNVTDACIMLIALAFLIARIIGLVDQNDQILKISMDIFSLEALLLVPRICALMSLHPFFGTLIPCLKKMSSDFVKFLGIVLILYIGWLTTFTMLGRAVYSPREISWYLVYVFFGSSYLGLDIASEISPSLGPPLMIIFISMTNILLITSLISLLSNTLDRIMEHSREQYLFQYSVFVLEASASRRLTYFFPPMNLIPLILLRPLRLCLPSAQIRHARIRLLKFTHFPYVAAIMLYEHYLDPLANKSGLISLERRPTSSTRTKRQSGPWQSPGRPSVLTALRTGKNEGSPTRTPLTSKHRHSSAAADSTIDELRWAVAKLSEQVEILTQRLDVSGNDPTAMDDPFE